MFLFIKDMNREPNGSYALEMTEGREYRILGREKPGIVRKKC